MTTPVDEFDLDIRLGAVRAEVLTDPMVMRTNESVCPTDECSSYPMCKTTERTC
ncbi:hypothetical protein NONI108955_24745 [Nocardia ninae]|uniref:Uncharacterized protein n=1 Tax=Nocardia ninae NBRC 108245 TaxID=1210091 RepID=A0A511M572_9NOCA|nr:hypothetical protein [Nocardia ninae]GEM35803.1 hypothetical protein NN4_03220 [Nocardia ninae NBRC 108245]